MGRGRKQSATGVRFACGHGARPTAHLGDALCAPHVRLPWGLSATPPETKYGRPATARSRAPRDRHCQSVAQLPSIHVDSRSLAERVIGPIFIVRSAVSARKSACRFKICQTAIASSNPRSPQSSQNGPPSLVCPENGAGGFEVRAERVPWDVRVNLASGFQRVLPERGAHAKPILK